MKTASLPSHARLPINRCNLPAVILGSLTFQQYPAPLRLDGVEELHARLFQALDGIGEPGERAELFKCHMRSCFLLDHPDEAGFDPAPGRRGRDKADYLRMLRGWLFDPDGKEAAVLKSWVESRFGLLPRNHRGFLGDFDNGPYPENTRSAPVLPPPLGDDYREVVGWQRREHVAQGWGGGTIRGEAASPHDRYQAYLGDRARGLYNTNALESQLDLLFAYCQYEIRRQYPDQRHISLYRGVNRIEDHEILARPDKRSYVLLLNNLNSFTNVRERADEFGDHILEAEIPLAKLLFLPGLLPGTLKGEDEYLVIGGVYQVKLSLL